MNIFSTELYLDDHGKPIPFPEYIKQTKAYISALRHDLNYNPDRILHANAPFELFPEESNFPAQNHYAHGALLIHGLLDSPFAFQDISLRLNSQGIPSRAVLLPGHGIAPEGLMSVTYQQWIDTVRYGIQSMRPLVDKLYLFGYSTGAALAIYHALQNEFRIDGLVMLSPAIQIKGPISVAVGWYKLLKSIIRNPTPWLFQKPEIDYAKYRSITFNAVEQVANLTQLIHQSVRKSALNIPICMIASRQDDTISCFKAIQFFSTHKHPDSQLLLYDDNLQRSFTDTRITVRHSDYPDLQIKQFSHVSLPFSPHNDHYGQKGDYVFASHLDNNAIYGAYNPFKISAFNWLYKSGVLKDPRRELTYNPDFEFMMQKINQFILQTHKK